MTRFWWEGDHQHCSNTRANSDRHTHVYLGFVVVGEKVVEIINGIEAEKHCALNRGTEKPAGQVELPRNCHRRSVNACRVWCVLEQQVNLNWGTWKMSGFTFWRLVGCSRAAASYAIGRKQSVCQHCFRESGRTHCILSHVIAIWRKCEWRHLLSFVEIKFWNQYLKVMGLMILKGVSQFKSFSFSE